MTRAENKAVEYQIKTHGPNVIGGASILSEEEYMRLNMNYDFKAGYEEAEKYLGWHPASEHPPVDEEVIVLTDMHGTSPLIYEIAFGHIVDKERCIDYDSWNIPGVVWWMPMPKIPKEEEK